MLLTRKSLEKLFISKVRIKALRYFVFNPNKEIHLRAAVREFNEEINAVRRELERLESIDFLITERRGNRKYFKPNTEHPYFSELVPLIHKAYGLGADILDSSKRLGTVDYALLTDSYTRRMNDEGDSSDYSIDLLIVGDVNMDMLAEIINKHEKKQKREIHYTVLKKKDFILRKKRRDAFVMEILLKPKVMLIGSRGELIESLG